MQIFRNQPGWTHVFGLHKPFPPLIDPPKRVHPFARRDIHLQPKPRESNLQKIRSGLRQLFQEYCSHSTIHGLSYVGSKRSLLERVSWLVVCSISMYCCGLLIQKTYQKWNEKPVIVSFSERPTSVWNIPFPAITICPEAKINVSAFNVTKNWYRFFNGEADFDELSRDRLMAVMQICDDFFHITKPFTQKYTDDSLDVVTLIEPLVVDGYESIAKCLRGKFKCKKEFFRTITRDGICFTYNGFSQEDMFRNDTLHSRYQYLEQPKSAVNWSLDNGYKKGSPIWTHPSRGTGYASRLVLYLLTYIQDLDAFCRETQGFKLLLHSPDEYPMISKKFLILSLDRDINIAVHPNIFTTSEELRNYKPDRRQCLFNDEKQLRFFRVYNQANCEEECVTNYTLKACGCVQFAMPHSAGTRICSTREIRCIIEAEVKLVEALTKQRSANPEKDLTPCGCLPACNSIQYHTDINQSPYDLQLSIMTRIKAVNITAPDYPKARLSRVQIFFKGAQFISSTRSELFGITDFIANCGGILGLCLGISLFSLVELMYYCIVRPLLLVRTTLRSTRKVTMFAEVKKYRF